MLDAAAVVLAAYSDEIMEQVTHPVLGLPGRLKWPPNIAEIKEMCDRLALDGAKRCERQAREAAQLRERAEYEARIADAPKIDFEARYGPNFGLGGKAEPKAEPKPIAWPAGASAELAAVLKEQNETKYKAEAAE